VSSAGRGTDRLVLLATLVGLILRVGFALAWPIEPREDAAHYHQLARTLAAGSGYVDADGHPTAFRPPGLPAFLAAIYSVAPDVPVTGRLALAIVSTLAVPATAVLGGALGGSTTRVVAAFAAALYPPFVTSWFSPRALLSEPLAVALATVAVALVVAAPDRRPRWWATVAAGFLTGLAALTKTPLLLLTLPLAVFTGQRSSWRHGAVLVLTTIATIAPWTARNALRLGYPVPISTNGGITLWTSYNPASRGLGNGEQGLAAALAIEAELRDRGLDEVARSRHLRAEATAAIRAEPGRALWLVGRKSLLFWDPTLKDWSVPEPSLAYNWGYGAALPLALAGAILGVSRRSSRAAATLYGVCVLTIAAAYITLLTDVRYRVVLEPFLLAFAAVAIDGLRARLGAARAALILAAFGLVQAAIAWHYDAVFGLLSAIVGGLGLG